MITALTGDVKVEAATIPAALEALLIGNDQFDQLERALDIFCPFEAVGMVKQEIRHAHFLWYILNPDRPHGFGTAALHGFMAAVTRAVHNEGAALSPLEVHLMAFDGADVRREWGSIDLLIALPDAQLVIAVELKIEADEHGDQLSRYRRTVEMEWPTTAGWRHLFVFLTKTGDQASEAEGEGWVAVALADVARALARIVNQGHGTPEARAMLGSYVDMLRRHHLDDDGLEELAQKLWSQHREALSFLADRRPDALGMLLRQLAQRDGEIAA